MRRPFPGRRDYGLMLVLLVAIGLALLFGGCHSGPSLEYFRAHVAAERQVFDVLQPDLEYLEQQATDPAERQDRQDLRYSWGRRIETAEELVRRIAGDSAEVAP